MSTIVGLDDPNCVEKIYPENGRIVLVWALNYDPGRSAFLAVYNKKSGRWETRGVNHFNQVGGFSWSVENINYKPSSELVVQADSFSPFISYICENHFHSKMASFMKMAVSCLLEEFL